MHFRRTGLLLLLMLGMTLYVVAQEEDEEQFRTVFGSDFNSGGYGAPEIKVGPVHGETGLLLGGRGGWIIGHQFVIGGAGFGLTTNNSFDEDPMNKPSTVPDDSTRIIGIDMGYGGLMLEYILFPKKAIHLSFPLIIGAGGSSLGAKTLTAQTEYYDGYTTYDYIESSGFFILEPGVYLELNMTKFFRLSAGATYRHISGLNLQRMDNNDLKGFTFNLALKFGKF